MTAPEPYLSALRRWHETSWRGGDKTQIVVDMKSALSDPESLTHAKARRKALDELNSVCGGHIHQRDHLGALELDLLQQAME